MVADIYVERKKPSVWPWVVGLVVLAVLIWAAVEMFGGERTDQAAEPDRDTTTVGAPATGGTTPAPAGPGVAPAAPTGADTMGVLPDTAFR